MELRHLKSFVVLAQELHFGRAAKRLHIVQPALSKQMQLLEASVGCRLLNRNRRGVALSEAGRLFLAEAEQAIQHIDHAVESARRVGLGQLGRIRIGYSASAVHSGVLASTLARVEEHLPELDIVLERVDPWQQTARLLANEVDMVFGPRSIEKPDENLESFVIAELEVCVALSARHPLAKYDVINSDNLKEETFIEFADSKDEGQAVVTHLLGIDPPMIIAKSDPLAVLALVQSGRGVCVLPSVLILPQFPQVIYRSVVGNPVLQVVVTSRRSGDEPMLNRLRDLIRAP